MEETFADVPFVAYLNTDIENSDVETGFLVAKMLFGKEYIFI